MEIKKLHLRKIIDKNSQFNDITRFLHSLKYVMIYSIFFNLLVYFLKKKVKQNK